MYRSDALQAGDIFVVGTEDFADYRAQLLPWPECESRLAADLTEVMSAMAEDGHPVTPALFASISPYVRDHIRRFGRSALDMADLPDPLNPQPLPFEAAL